jgi:aminocarboxymuconate-semialdehyde decarboxylase
MEPKLIIDFHNHFYPKGYLDELKRGKGYASVETDRQGRLLIRYTGDYNVVVGPHLNLDDRIRAMDRYGVDIQVLTLTTPGVEREEPERGRRLAELANDGFARIVEKHHDRFTALATLPLQDPEAAAIELERAVKDCGLKGAMLLSNVNGQPLDSEKFLPVFEKAVKLDVPLHIHPTSPINYTAMDDFRLVPILGFGVDTTLSLLRLVFKGVLKRLPALKLVASHLGGVFPYLRGRIDTGFQAYPECKINISEPPSRYLKKVWADSICYDNNVFMSTYAFLGPNKIMLGTDFPHEISDLERSVGRIMELNIDDEDKERILGDNAAELLKL